MSSRGVERKRDDEGSAFRAGLKQIPRFARDDKWGSLSALCPLPSALSPQPSGASTNSEQLQRSAVPLAEDAAKTGMLGAGEIGIGVQHPLGGNAGALA